MQTLSNFHNGVLATSFTFLSKALGFFSAVLTARYFGAGTDTDIVFFTWGLFSLLAQLFQSLNSSVLLPEFVRLIHNEGLEAAAKLLGLFLTRISTLLAGITLIYCLKPEFFLGLISRFSPEEIQTSLPVLYCLAPAPLLLFSVDLFMNLVQARQNFLICGLSSLINSIAIILSIALGHEYGPVSLAAGFVLGSLLQLIWLVLALNKSGLRIRFLWRSQSDLLKIKSLWFFTLLMQISACLPTFLCEWFASGLGSGELTSLNYGRRVHDLMPNILIFPLVLTLYPRLCQLKDEEGDLMAGRARDMAMLLESLIYPLAIFACYFAEELVQLIYGTSGLDLHAMNLAANAIRYLSVSTPLLVSISIFSHALLALQNPRIPKFLLMRNLIQLVSLGLLLHFLVPVYQASAIPMAISLTFLGGVLPVTMLLSRTFIGRTHFFKRMGHTVTQILLSLGLIFLLQVILGSASFSSNRFLFAGILYLILLAMTHIILQSPAWKLVRSQFLKRKTP